MKLLTIAFLIAILLSGCRKPEKITPKIYKAYSGNYAEKTQHYGVELTWEY